MDGRGKRAKGSAGKILAATVIRDPARRRSRIGSGLEPL
jgi:hypothetical protein